MKGGISLRKHVKLKDIEEQTEELCLKVVSRHAHQLVDVKEPTEAICLAAVRKNGLVLNYVPLELRTPTVCETAVSKHGMAIRFVPHPTEALKHLAVQNMGCALQCISNPTDSIQYEAVKQDGYAIQYIDQPTRRHQLEAIKQNPRATKYISDLTEEMWWEVATRSEDFLKYLSEIPLEYQLIMKRDENFVRFYLRKRWETELITRYVWQPRIQRFQEVETKGLRSVSEVIQEEPKILLLLPNALKSYRLCRLATRLHSEVRLISPYHALECLEGKG